MKNPQSPAECQKAYQEITLLIKRAIKNVSKSKGNSFYNTLKLGNQFFYSVQVNRYLLQNCSNVMLPLAKEKWPVEFTKIITNAADLWPIMTNHVYTESIFTDPFINQFSLNFGYAVIAGKLRKTSFYVPEQLIKNNVIPMEIVIDPMAALSGISPDYYLGTRVDKRDLESYLLSSDDPLESFVNRKDFIKRNNPSRSVHHASFSDGLEYLPK